MPYMVMDKCVHKQNADGSTGEVVKCHDTAEQAAAHMAALYANVEDAATKATAEDNNLPDSAFLYVESGGSKDGEGKTVPRSLRHLPYRTASGAIDLPRLRNALSRLGQSNTGDTSGDRWLTASLRDSLRAKAEKLLQNANKETVTDNILPEGVTMGEMIQIAELTADETQAIDRLYRDVVSGKVKLESLAEPEMATGKASVSYGSRSGGGPAGNPSGTPGGSQGDHSSKAERCYMRVKKLGADDATARKVCHSMFGGRPGIKQARQEASFTVYKQANGAYRWLAVTSSSFQDRDREIVSQKALEADTERMNTSGDYGALDWWHTPITLGACDFSAMHGRLSVESGTFRDAWTATKLAEAKGGFEMSRAFYHPITEPDPQGVYHNIKTFSRAIIPRGIGKASNLLTTFTVVEKEKQMLTDKIKELKSLFGGNKEASDRVDALLAEAEQKEKAAADAGIAAKEQKLEAAPETPAAKETPITDQPGMFVADMKPEEFDAHIATAINAAVKPLMDQLNALKEANAVAVKESSASVLAAALVEIKKLQDAQAETAKQVKELNGLTPRGYRATQDPATATTKDTKGPGADEKKSYFEQFVSGFVLGQPQPPVK